MDIGAKLKAARTAAGLTQEQAAAALGVSRQTISNWENAKTYPDIVSVVHMSDLYAVSLDHLLKGDAALSPYVHHLAASTDEVASRRRQSFIALVLVYLGIWAFSLIVFWFFADGSDAMGYWIMFLWILLPVTTLVISLLIGRNGYGGRRKWLTCPACGVLYALAHYATFSAANMAAFGRFYLPSFSMFVTGTIISLLGLAVGHVFSRRAGRT